MVKMINIFNNVLSFMDFSVDYRSLTYALKFENFLLLSAYINPGRLGPEIPLKNGLEEESSPSNC